MKFSRTPSFVTRIEEAAAQTLDSRFRDMIPKVIPDCFIDLLTNAVIFPQTAQIAEIEASRSGSADFLASRKIKTIGLLEPLCVSKMFVGETQAELSDEIAAHNKSHKDLIGSENAITDGFVFEAADGRYFGYTDTLLPHTKSQIAARFSAFLESGGAIVSVQSRILPITRLALREEEASICTERAVLFCEISEGSPSRHSVQVWTAVNCGNKIFSPLVSQSSDAVPFDVNYAIESVCSQTKKQYRMWNPSLAILIDGSENNENDENHENRGDIRRLLSEACGGNILEMGKNLSRHASLYGAILLGGERP
jgi:hypothetical protein